MPRGEKSPREFSEKHNTHTPHTPHTHLTHTAAPTMSGSNIIYEKQFKRHKKDSSWESLRPASVSYDDASPDNNGKARANGDFSDIYSISAQQHQEQQST